MSLQPHILVLGAGFAGLEFCKSMRDAPVRITLIDRQNHHLFQPLLYQVASAGLAAPEIAHPIRSVFAKQKNVTVLMDEVRAIDLDGRKVATANRELDYDYLVIGLGVKTGYFGHPDWEAHTSGLKSLDDATRMRRKVLLAFENAEACDDPGEKKRLMTVAIVGGGPTGVELAGAVAELVRVVLKRDFRHIDTSEARILLVEAGPRLLPVYDDELSDYTRAKLESMGVTVLTDSPVQEIREGEIDLPDRTIRAGNILWTAGVEAVPLTKTMGVETDPAGRLIVETDLSLPGHRDAFAVGDIAHCVDREGVRVPGMCPGAIQMGKHAATVILEDIRRGSNSGGEYAVRSQFQYFDKGSMATIGRSAAVASSMGMNFRGLIAWLMWLFIHLFFLIGFRTKITVLIQWFYAYVRYRRGARIITGMDKADASES